MAHALLLLSSDVVKKDSEDWSDLAWKVGMCLYYDGRWKEAGELFVQVMETSSRVLGAEYPSTLTSMANLALMYRNQG
jgi:Tetratricopeptide repeat